MPEPLAPEMYYFGCWHRPGHYLYTMTGSLLTTRTVPQDFPCMLVVLDGGFLPPCLPQDEGRTTLVHLNGWTILSFWDRSGDMRLGSSSTFLTRGLHTFEAMCALAQRHFRDVWARMPFPVGQWHGKELVVQMEQEG